MKKTIHSMDLARRLSGYAASAGALALIGSAANAQVIHSGPQNVELTLPEDYVELDMDGDGTTDFGFVMYSTGTYYTTGASSFVYYNMNYGAIFNPKTDGYNNSWVAKTGIMSVIYQTYSVSTSYGVYVPVAAPLNENVMVDASVTYWGNAQSISYIGVLDYAWVLSYYWSYYSALIYYGAGEFAGQKKYLGVRFYIGGDQHYGWIRVDMAGNASVLNIIDWAYESTPNTGILTGAGGDSEGPVLAISGVGTTSTSRLVTLTVDADEDIDGLTADDISVTNGTVMGITAVSDSQYEVNIQSSSFGIVSVVIAAGNVSDLYGNPSESAASISWEYISNDLNLTKGEGVSLFPNPVSNELFIELEGEADIRLIDLNGRVMYQQERIISHSINVSDFTPGIYLVQIRNDEGIHHERVVIE